MAGMRNTIVAIAHDLRSPLNRAYMLLQDAADARATRTKSPSCSRMRPGEMDALGEIMDTVLRISRIESSDDSSSFALFSATVAGARIWRRPSSPWSKPRASRCAAPLPDARRRALRRSPHGAADAGQPDRERLALRRRNGAASSSASRAADGPRADRRRQRHGHPARHATTTCSSPSSAWPRPQRPRRGPRPGAGQGRRRPPPRAARAQRQPPGPVRHHRLPCRPSSAAARGGGRRVDPAEPRRRRRPPNINPMYSSREGRAKPHP